MNRLRCALLLLVSSFTGAQASHIPQQTICFEGFTGQKEIASVSLRLEDGAGQCCGTSEPNCTSAQGCNLFEPNCVEGTGCFGIPQYADCRFNQCFCQIRWNLYVDEQNPCVDLVACSPEGPDHFCNELFETREGWLRWLVLVDPGSPGECGPIP